MLGLEAPAGLYGKWNSIESNVCTKIDIVQFLYQKVHKHIFKEILLAAAMI